MQQEPASEAVFFQTCGISGTEARKLGARLSRARSGSAAPAGPGLPLSCTSWSPELCPRQRRRRQVLGALLGAEGGRLRSLILSGASARILLMLYRQPPRAG